MTHSTHIQYIEFTAPDLEKIKEFYSSAFGWIFNDYGSNYISFENSGIEGGFEKSDKPIVNGALVILYHKSLEEIQTQIIEAGGKISVETFSFPGGKRFHFLDPAGNQLAVWSEDNK